MASLSVCLSVCKFTFSYIFCCETTGTIEHPLVVGVGVKRDVGITRKKKKKKKKNGMCHWSTEDIPYSYDFKIKQHTYSYNFKTKKKINK